MASEDLGKDLVSVNNLLKKHAVSIFENIHKYPPVFSTYIQTKVCGKAHSRSYIKCKLVQYTLHNVCMGC